MKRITDDLIQTVNNEMWNELEKRHKSMFRIPKDDVQWAGEVVRAMYVLQLWQKHGSSGNPVSFMAGYSVMPSVVEHVVPLYVGKHVVIDKSEKTEKRKDKWSSFLAWAKQHAGSEFTTEQLVEKSGFSYQSTLKYVNNTPEFIKIKKGKYRISKPE